MWTRVLDCLHLLGDVFCNGPKLVAPFPCTQVATGVELYVAPASSQVQQEAERLGYWNDLIVAGYAERRAVA